MDDPLPSGNMYLLYVLRCSNFFISGGDSEFFRSTTPDNSDAEDEDKVKKPKHVSIIMNCIPYSG